MSGRAYDGDLLTPERLAEMTRSIAAECARLKRELEADLAEHREIADEVRKRRAATSGGGS